MKKNLLFLLMVLLTATGYAQYTVSGTVMTSTSVPVVGQTVYISTDSAKWTTGMSPAFWTSAVTNTSGAYTATMPTTITSGHPVSIYTANCSTGPALWASYTYAGVNITHNFTKCVAPPPPPPPSISGKIYTGSTGAANAKVYFIDKYQDSVLVGSTWTWGWWLKAIDSTTTNSTGDYTKAYPTYVRGNLLVKACLMPASTVYSSYLPTYYTSSLIWSGATALPSSSVVTANVSLIGGTNPGGAGFVGGSVLLGANKGTGVGDPLPGRLILLTDNAGNAIAYTTSDATGHFSFPSLAYGTYKIFGDVMAKSSTPLTITLSAATATINNIKFEEKALTFNPSMSSTSVNTVSGISTISVYPNPMSNVVTIDGLNNIKGDKDAVLTDITGKQLGNYHFAANTEASINVSTLPAGIYVLQLTTSEGNATYKLTK
jgi:hypothetical protein